MEDNPVQDITFSPKTDQYTPSAIGTINTYNPTPGMVEGIRVKTKKPNSVDFAIGRAQNDSAINSLFAPTDNKKSFQNEGFRVGDAYTRLSTGEYIPKYENFLQGTDNEDRLAREQATSNKWSRGLVKFWGKTNTAVLGGTVGSVYGLGAAITEGDWTAIWDNDFTDMMDDWNKGMDNSLSNYYTKEERDMGFFSSMGTANFWANDFLGGLSFTAGAIISEGIWAAATGGASLAVGLSRRALRAANALDKIGDTAMIARNLKKGAKPLLNHLSKIHGVERAKNIGKGVQALNTARYIYTSAGYEAGVEARGYIEEQRMAFDLGFEEINGREPTPEERALFEKGLSSTANSVFATNLALVGSSNLMIFGKMFNINNPLKGTAKGIRKAIFGQGVNFTGKEGVKAVKRNLAQRVAGTAHAGFKNMFIEGVYEEGLQAVTATSAGAFLESTYNTSEDTMGLLESVYEGFSHTYGTKEGWKEVGLGMLIGAFGGGAAAIGSGQNPFSGIIEASKKTSKRDESVAKVLNKYSSKKLANELFRMNALDNANKVVQEGLAKGDLAHSEAGRTMGMLANIMYAENMGYGKEIQEQFEEEIKNLDAETLSENLGITLEEAEKMKVDAKEDYISIKDTFNKNKEFATYIVGQGKVKGQELNVEVARDMIAYQMTMADKTEELSEDFTRALMAEIGDFNSYGTRLKTTIEVENILRKAKKEDRAAHNELKKQHKSLQRKSKELENKRQKQEFSVNASKEGSSNMAGTLNNTILEIAKTHEEMLSVEESLERSISAMSIQGMEANEEGTYLGKDLANIEDNLNDLESYLDRLKTSNPEKHTRITSLIKGYKSSITGAKMYSEVIEDLLNPETGLKGTTRTFLNRAKEENTPTERLIKNLQKQQLEFAAGVAPIFTDESENIKSVEGTSSDIGEDSKNVKVEGTRNITEGEKTKIEDKYDVTILDDVGIGNYKIKPNTKTEEGRKKAKEARIETVKVTKSPKRGRKSGSKNKTEEEKKGSILERLQDRLSKLIEKNNYVLQNYGNNLEQSRPSEEEIERFKTLKRRLKVDPDTFINKPIDRIPKKASGLTKEEILEFKELNQKLSNWKIIDGVTIGGVSIVDILNQMSAYEAEVKKEDIENLGETGHLEVGIGMKNSGNRAMTTEMINTQENALVASINGEVHLSHIGLEFFLEKGAKIYKRGIEVTDFSNMQQGTYVVMFEDREVVVKLGDHARLEMSEDNFSKLSSEIGLVIFNVEEVKGTKWNPIYIKQEDGTYQPLESTFKTTDEGSDFNILDPQALYELEEGEQLFFKVSLTDSFNTTLRKEWGEAKQAVLEDPSVKNKKKLRSVKDKIKKQGHIYIVNSNGDVVGQVKAASNDTNSVGSFLAIRSQTANILVKESLEGQTLYTLPFTTSVTKVYSGSPNLKVTINEEGKAILDMTDFNERTIDMIDSFGVITDGVIESNKNKKINAKEVNMQFVSKIKNPTPFVVIKYGKQKIAYPINIKPGVSEVINKVEDIYNSKVSSSEKAESLIRILSEEGVDPGVYNIRHIDGSDTFFGSEEEQKMFENLEGVESLIPKEKFLSTKYKVQDMGMDSQIPINLENKPFNNPKVKMDLKSELLYRKDADLEEQRRFDITGKAEAHRLQAIANELLSKKQEELSSFNKKILSLYSKQIESLVKKKLKMSEGKTKQSETEKNKKC